MDDSPISTASVTRKKPFFLFSLIQWIMTALLALDVLLMLADVKKLGLPGAPVPLYCITIAAIALVTLLHSPPVFFRLPIRSRIFAYLGLIGAMALFSVYVGQMEPIWYRTPEGAKEAAAKAKEAAETAAREKAEAQAVAQREKDAQIFAEAEETGRQLEEMRKRLESCFSWGHQLPALTEAVEKSLHNPDSFEHVETILIVPDENRNNVVMKFRGQNGFGGIRTAIVKAQLVADGCIVQNIGVPTE